MVNTIQAIRVQRGLTQVQVSVRSGLRLGVVCRIEQGRVRNPRWRTMIALADTLSVSLDQLRDLGFGLTPDSSGSGRAPAGSRVQCV